MSKKRFNSLLFTLVLAVLFFANLAFAKTDLSIAETDITLSKNEPLNGDIVRVYARIFNTGDVDVLGHVVFFDNGKEMSEPQPVSVKAGTYDDVFIDWTAKEGKHDIKANVIVLSPKDDNLENNSTTKANIIVDIDTDKDGTPDLKDTDADNDGLTNEEEQKLGTNSLVADTDGDGVNDKVDVFPLNKTEWRDTNNNGVGDNEDPDIDGDGLTNTEEKELGTNPLVADAKPLKTDASSQNNPPSDFSKWQASILGSIGNFFKGKEFFLALGIPSLFILLLLFRKKKRR